MPQLDSAMFTDQIYFMSIIFYLTHVYGNEVIIPNISAVKQYRNIKLNLFSLKIKNLSFFILFSNLKKNNQLKLNLTNLSKEILGFNYILVFLLSSKYKYLYTLYNDILPINFFVLKKNIFKNEN